MATYYAEDGYPFVPEEARRQLVKFLTDPALGGLWVALAEGAVVGYLIVTLGFSFEYGGRDAFIDELYIAGPFRGAGLGHAALQVVEAYADNLRIGAVHLEVGRHRTRAAGLYATQGFRDTGRVLMSKRFPKT